MRTGISAALGALMAAGAWIGPGTAQEAGKPPAQSSYPTVSAVLGACQADLVRLCGDVPFRMNLMAGCLREKRDALSTGCQALQTDVRARSRETRDRLRPAQRTAETACAADVKSLCGEVTRGKAAACVRANESKVSEACRTATAELRRMQREARAGAGRD